jgi:hypothetical protein
MFVLIIATSCFTRTTAQNVITSKIIDIDPELMEQLDAKISKYQIVQLSVLPKQAQNFKFSYLTRFGILTYQKTK